MTESRPSVSLERQPSKPRKTRRSASQRGGGVKRPPRSKAPRGDRDGLRPPAAIVPPQAVAGRALTLVVAIMSFLACLTVGVVAIVRDAAEAWSNDLVREVTIQIRPAEGVDMLREIDKAIALAGEFPGVGSVRALSDQETRSLLQPWLGPDLNLEALPVPRLIQVTIDDSRALDLAALRKAVHDQIAGGSVDDHTAWTDRLAAMAGAVVVAGFALLVLVLGSMVLSVVFATRAAMAGNRDVVEVLHFVGAEDSFIAREFQRHFLVLGLRGGIAGGLAACLLFVILEFAAREGTGLAGVEQASVLFGPISIGVAGYLGVLAVVFMVTVLTALTSRVAVHAHLSRMD